MYVKNIQFYIIIFIIIIAIIVLFISSILADATYLLIWLHLQTLWLSNLFPDNCKKIFKLLYYNFNFMLVKYYNNLQYNMELICCSKSMNYY